MSADLKLNPALIRGGRRLTDKQKNLLFFIAEYLAEHSVIPSNTEMCRFMSVNSNNASPYLKALANKGFLYREEGVGYFPTSAALSLLDAEGKNEILEKIAVRDEEQLEMRL